MYLRMYNKIIVIGILILGLPYASICVLIGNARIRTHHLEFTSAPTPESTLV